jgi:hypothetical protein
MSPYPPLGEFRTAPTETHIPSKSGVGYRVEATAPALLSDPTGWDTPSLGQFFGGKNLEEGADNGCVLCSDLCSSSFSWLCYQRVAMCGGSSNRRLFKPGYTISSLTALAAPVSHSRADSTLVLPFPASSVIPLADRVPGWVVKLHTMPASLHSNRGSPYLAPQFRQCCFSNHLLNLSCSRLRCSQVRSRLSARKHSL